jgi:hypothetical protein
VPSSDDESVTSPNDLLDIPLTAIQQRLLANGINEWGGPARCTEELAVAMGFATVGALFEETPRLHSAIRAGTALAQADWVRVLLMTEIVFASEVVGSGWDWRETTGMSDEETIRELREIQLLIPKAGVLGVSFGSLPAGPFA